MDLEKRTAEDLYEELKKLDLKTAMKTHPNNRRKIINYILLIKQKGVKPS